MRVEEIKAAVEASPLLGGCNLPASGMQVKYCHKGQIVSDRQKNEEILGLIMDGSMDVYSIALDGREILLSQLEKGDCFGVVNLLTKTELPTVLRCRTDTTLVIIPKCQLLSAMEKNSELALRYAGFCNKKMQFLIRRIEFLTMQSGKKKLVQYLLEVPGKRRAVWEKRVQGRTGIDPRDQPRFPFQGACGADKAGTHRTAGRGDLSPEAG